MDELFETLTLVQTGIIRNFPVVLIGEDYYQPLMDYLQLMVKQRTISPSDLQLICLTNSPEKAMQHIHTFIDDNYVIKQKRKPLWWLLER